MPRFKFRTLLIPFSSTIRRTETGADPISVTLKSRQLYEGHNANQFITAAAAAAGGAAITGVWEAVASTSTIRSLAPWVVLTRRHDDLAWQLLADGRAVPGGASRPCRAPTTAAHTATAHTAAVRTAAVRTAAVRTSQEPTSAEFCSGGGM